MEKVEIVKIYYPNGQLQQETPYVNGESHGIAKWWRENGQLECEISYVNGEGHGIMRWWHDNGQLEGEFPYVNGVKHGAQRWWHENGNLDDVRIYNKSSRKLIIPCPNNLHIKQVPKFTREQWRKIK